MINIVVYKRYNLKHLIMEGNATIGEQRVQKSFNPNANPVIEDLKQQYADLETSCMYAVKSLFA